jgi:8-oxo-dGTP pyrophosphatase MutT (NUDIX family)
MTTVAMPRLAASLILLREGPAGLEAMMVERSGSASFAAGAFVFPGGRVDESDASLLASPLPDAALRIAAIRETYEECGLLLVEGGAAACPPAVGDAPPADFGTLVRDHGVRPSMELLVPLAHWITPPDRPKRFDTHFFLAAGPHDQVAVADLGEVMSAAWLRPAALVAAAEAGELNLMFATYMNLRWLAKHEALELALAAARKRQVVTVIPEPVSGPGGRLFRIPADAGYGEAEVLERRFRRT